MNNSFAGEGQRGITYKALTLVRRCTARRVRGVPTDRTKIHKVADFHNFQS